MMYLLQQMKLRRLEPITWENSALRMVPKGKEKVQINVGDKVIPQYSSRLEFANQKNSVAFTKFMYGAAQEFLAKLNQAINDIAQSNTADNTIATMQNYDELIKLKELLDINIITKEEFEQKKKIILGL